ncbi:MAG TPA: bifunctional UDP-N-acetylglucosamine diphosphorylase/glucosamine-1-phosphate N-acetyltransferase GlmU [Nitrosomonas mobilis]|nr:bifunctional UDP-N-acetylglucosamine diphosphorylase/glucosamine-1-phosphate N-acetyltransferase GlmU [Nitrosomonas mobilis]
MSGLDVVILAAGAGKRMYSTLPKVLHKLAGKPLLQHVLDTAQCLLPSQICIVYGHGGELVRSALDDPSLVWIEQAQRLGTGHALKQALPVLRADGATLVLFGDVPLVKSETLELLVRQAHTNCLALLTVKLNDPTGYGRIVRDAVTGDIRAIVEEKDANTAQRAINEINTGIMLLPNKFLSDWLARLDNANNQGEYYLTDIVAMAVKDGIRVISASPANSWESSGVNNKLQLAELERIYQRNYANKLMLQGVMLADPARIDIRGRLNCGSDVEIDINCLFEGNVELGDRVKIQANCVLRDVAIADGTVVSAFTLIEHTTIGQNCRIGPYARIRPGTYLDQDVHIGNFVEIKNSQIAAGSKVNHLSYIGDSQIGRNVNVGAGTITCNYDGAHKHRTIIEDNVFIGSDCQLIAPVKVARGATIGAGSTITRDAPAEQLSLSRSRQTSIPNWKRPKKDHT